MVSFTMGNAPVTDLQATSPSGKHFSIDVKGQSTKNFWLLRRRVPEIGHYFVLVYIPRQEEPPRFFIISSEEAMAEREAYKKSVESRSRPYDDGFAGFNWGSALKYEGRWEALPK